MLFVSDYDWNIDLLLWTVLAIYFRFIVSTFPWSFVFFWHWTFFTTLPWKFATRVHWLKFVFINSNWVFLPLTVNSIHTYIHWKPFDEKHLKERKQKIFKLNHLKYIKISTEIEISVETFQIEIFNGTPNFWAQIAIFVFIFTANA